MNHLRRRSRKGPSPIVGGGPHNHDSLYAPIEHAHEGYASAAHDHNGTYATINHDHAGTYEPADVNIQNHITSPHAPSDAQKNSNITKAEIEAKLTGEISTHTHAGGGGDPFTAKLRLNADVPAKPQR